MEPSSSWENTKVHSSRTPSPREEMKPSHSQDDLISPVPEASISSNSSPGSSFEPLGRIVDPQNTFEPAFHAKSLSEPSLDGMVGDSDKVPNVVSTLSGERSASSSSLTTTGSNALKGTGKATPTRRRQLVKARNDTTSSAEKGPNRRQKRLERNRESARLSRRRRKQYLEVLEERVTQLGQDMDHGRREHVRMAVSTIINKREHHLNNSTSMTSNIESMYCSLARTSQELMVVNTFQSQQLRSFCLPPSTKFILWLSLQRDEYFRGGRAASERLSAARIGERMFSGGTDRAAPNQSMWPLLCYEVGLSYDQEERVRGFQRTLLQANDSWLHRHTSYASSRVVESMHEATQALTLRLGQRERSTTGILTPQQRAKFLSWVSKNKERLPSRETSTQPECFALSKSHHVSANLYILNDRLSRITDRVPGAAPLVTGPALKKLLRRPSFESLGAAIDRKESNDGGLSRENSFASSGSLKRSASEMSMETEERPQIPSISPEEAQAASAHIVEEALGFLKSIIPPFVTPSFVTAGSTSLLLPAPTPVSSMIQRPYIPVLSQTGQSDPQLPDISESSVLDDQETMGPKHERKSSFLPPHLNVVPEEMWPVDAADDILMNLVEEDWAIGEGIDMDTH